MINEDYVSFELAKLLKEKGFDEYCWKYYELSDCDIPVLLNGFELSEESSFWNNKYLELYKKEHCWYINDICSAPTHQMAMKWLREVHNIDIIIFHEKLPNDCYWARIERNLFTEFQQEPEYNYYGEAVESALKYCIENLI